MIKELIEFIISGNLVEAKAEIENLLAYRIGQRINEESTHEWFTSLSSEQQASYLKMHPKSELRKTYKVNPDGKVVTNDEKTKEAVQKKKPEKKDISTVKAPEKKAEEKPVPQTNPNDEVDNGVKKPEESQETITLTDLKMKHMKNQAGDADRTPATEVKGKSAQDILVKNGSPTDMTGPDAESGMEGDDAEFERDLIAGLANLAAQGKEWKTKAKEAGEGGKEFTDKPPTFELCTISVPGTNLFCGNNLGIPRKKMPQLSGEPEEGSKAASLPKDANGGVSIETLFKQQLESDGKKLSPKKVDVATLKATQTELDGAKVAGMLETLKVDPTNEALNAPIYVSKDGYILDGHHRWAALLGLGIADGLDEPVAMNVVEVDMDIEDLVDYTNNYAKEMGIKQKSAGETTGDKKSIKESTELRDAAAARKFISDLQSDPMFHTNPLNPREKYAVMDDDSIVLFELVYFDGYVHMSSIFTPPETRKKGYASEVMQYLTDKADAYGVTMDLNPEPFGDKKTSKVVLKKFYKKFGFVEKERGYSMVRYPK